MSAQTGDRVTVKDVRSPMLDANSALEHGQLDEAEERLGYAQALVRRMKAQEADQ